MRPRNSLVRLVLLSSALCLPCKPSVACPNCKEAVAAQPKDAGGLASGYNWSVLFMIATPFTLLGTGVFLVRRAAANGSLPEL